MTDEWSEWIDHDGDGCPCPGRYVRVLGVTVGGVEFEREGIPTNKDPRWKWDLFGRCGVEWFGQRWNVNSKFVRYRIRRPRGMTILQKLIEHLPEREHA